MLGDMKRGLYKFIFAVVTFNILIWLSVFLYGMFYYLYIPAVAHFRTVNFKFDTVCPNGACSFPSANIALVKRGHNQLLTRGQPYIVVLDLEMPESYTNQNLVNDVGCFRNLLCDTKWANPTSIEFSSGMFMVKLDMIARKGEVTRRSLRSGVLHFKSRLHRILHTLFFAPLLLSGTTEEKQLVSVTLFEHYEEDPMRPALSCYIEVQSHSIEIYSATLRIHAEFTGLRYFMYYWPMLSAVVGIGTNFFFLSMISLFSWVRFLLSKEDEVILALDASDTPDLFETRRAIALERLKKERRLQGALTNDEDRELLSSDTSLKKPNVENIGHVGTVEDILDSKDIPEVNKKTDFVSEVRKRRP